jgi:hypothetical protein
MVDKDKSPEEIKYFSKMLGGSSMTPDTKIKQEFINLFIMVAIGQLLSFARNMGEEGEAMVTQTIAIWKATLESQISEELDRHDTMMNTRTGKVLGGMMGVAGAPELHVSLDAAQAEVEEIINKVLGSFPGGKDLPESEDDSE